MLWLANIAYIIEGVNKEYQLNTFETGFLASSFNIGQMFGVMFWGFIADEYGRMYSFKSSVTICAVFSLLLTVSAGPVMIGTSLMLVGVGISGEISVGGTVFYEFCPISKAYYLTYMAIFWPIGGTVSAFLAYVGQMVESQVEVWRIIVGLSCLFEVVCVYFRYKLEETPVFCEVSGQIQRMNKIFNDISMENKGTAFDLALPEHKDPHFVVRPKGSDTTWSLVKELLSGDNLKNVMVFAIVFCIQIYFSLGFAFIGILYFMPYFLSDLTQDEAYLIILVQQASGIPSVLLGSWLEETSLGRKYTFVISFVLSGICSLLFCYSENKTMVLGIQVIVCTSVLNLLMMMGYSVLFTLTPESFQPSIRSLGVGTSQLFAKISAVVCPIFIGWLLTVSSGFQVSVLVFTGLIFGSALLGFLIGETKPEVKKEGLLKSY